MSDSALPLFSRFWLAFACSFRVLFDGTFARQIRDQMAGVSPTAPALEKAKAATPQASQPKIAKKAKPPNAGSSVPPSKPKPEPPSPDAALMLLTLFQREGRLIDFLQQDITDFDDEEIGAVARNVHTGCRKALRGHLTFEPIHKGDEGSATTVEEGYAPAEIKLVGDVKGSAPFKGTVRHRGWRATEIKLPIVVGEHDASVVAPAEVEL